MLAKRKCCVAAIMLLSASLMLLAFSACSPLYPTNPWADANCFHTMARGIVNGMLPYRDLVEQKGPLLYFLHVPAVLISPNGFFGVYLLEILALTAFMYISWRMVSLFVREKYWPFVILSALVIVTGHCFEWGDSAEELCAPIFAWSLYEAMKYFSSPQRKMTRACLLRNGILAGCILWIKFSLLGFHFAWMAVIAIESVVRERKIGRALRMCLLFLSGMALASLPWLILYAASGALNDLWQVYFVQNIFKYHDNVNLLTNVIKNVIKRSRNNLFMVGAMGAGILYMLFGKRKDCLWLKVCLIAMMICAVFLVYSNGKGIAYYYLVLAPFVPFGCVALARLWERLRKMRLRKLLSAFLVGALGLYSCAAMACNRNTYAIGVDREDMPQVKFAKIISETENATLLNFGFLDDGFYLAADVMPSNRWFCKLLANKEACDAEQFQLVADGAVDYVVSCKFALDDFDFDSSAYELVAQDRVLLDHDHAGEALYLYRKKDLNAQDDE